MAECLAKFRGRDHRGAERREFLAGARRKHDTIVNSREHFYDARETFLSRASRSCDFGATLRAPVSIIFLLTSLCVDSIHSISCNKTPLQNSMKNGKGRIDPWQLKRKQRKKAARSTKQLQQAMTKGTR
jgi:hypothetical protein